MRIADPSGMSLPKRFVYILRAAAAAAADASRLAAHNSGHCSHTANARPWEVVVIVEFADEHRAVSFERYLKSESGLAFARRHQR